MLRDLREKGFVCGMMWVDTNDNIANVLTKLNSNGTLPMKELTDLLTRSFWEPERPFKWNGIMTDPNSPVHIPAIVIMPAKIKTTTATPDDSTSSGTKTSTTATPSTNHVTQPACIQYYDLTAEDNEDANLLFDWGAEDEAWS